MKKLLLLACGFIANVAVAAPIGVASYVFDDSAFVKNVSGTSGSLYSSNNGAAAITDMDVSTYIYSSNSGTIGLSFGSTAIYNGAGADLALFFLGDTSTVNITLAGAGQTRSYTSNYMYASNGQQYGVLTNGVARNLSVTLINLDDFGLASNAALGGFTVGLGVNNYMSLVGGFHTQPTTTVVPLPAPFVLMFSGLAALGLIGRRKQ